MPARNCSLAERPGLGTQLAHRRAETHADGALHVYGVAHDLDPRVFKKGADQRLQTMWEDEQYASALVSE